MCYVNLPEPVPHASLPDSMRHGLLRSPTTHAVKLQIPSPVCHSTYIPQLCCEPHSTDDSGHILVFFWWPRQVGTHRIWISYSGNNGWSCRFCGKNNKWTDGRDQVYLDGGWYSSCTICDVKNIKNPLKKPCKDWDKTYLPTYLFHSNMFKPHLRRFDLTLTYS